MVFLSFGAGVQSSVLLMMGLRGEIERPDSVLWSDTGFESEAVYAHVEWAERQCKKHKMPFYRVKAKQTLKESFEEFEKGDRAEWSLHPPLFSKFNGKTGPLHRNCTRDVKITPLRRKQIELLGYRSSRGIPDGAAVIQLGFSIDEAQRASPSTESWADLSFPLIDPLKMSRVDCQSWWDDHYPHVNLPSSSCVICPYKTRKMWAQMSKSSPGDFAVALEYDERIRDAYKSRSKGREVFIHPDMVPLKEAIMRDDQYEMDLDDGVYCAGGCGL